MKIRIMDVTEGTTMALGEWERVAFAAPAFDPNSGLCDDGVTSAEECHVWWGGASVGHLRVQAELVDAGGHLGISYAAGSVSGDGVFSRKLSADTMQGAKDALVALLIERRAQHEARVLRLSAPDALAPASV